MTAMPPEPPEGGSSEGVAPGGGPPGPPSPPPPPPGPWASDNLPPHPGATAVGQVEQPSTIVAAVRLMRVGAVLSGLGLLLSLATTDTMRDQITEDNPEFTADEIDAAVAFGIGFAVVVTLIAIGLWLWMAWANGQGKSWARIVATVLGGANVLFSLVSLALTPPNALGLVLTVVSLALAVWILVLLYRPESSQFYDARSRTW